MRYKLSSGKTITIPDATIKQFMSSLDLTKEEAIQMYLEDEGELENEEQIALDNKAKKMAKSMHDVDRKPIKRDKKPKTVKVSDEKKVLFDIILSKLIENDVILKENVTVLNQNKLIEVQINDKKFKINITETRKPKS